MNFMANWFGDFPTERMLIPLSGKNGLLFWYNGVVESSMVYFYKVTENLAKFFLLHSPEFQ